MSKEDFSWSKKMTVKDRNLCKAQFDILFNKLASKDEDINAMNKVLELTKKKSSECIERLKSQLDRDDKDVEFWKNKFFWISSSHKSLKRLAVILFLAGIIVGLATAYIIVVNW